MTRTKQRLLIMMNRISSLPATPRFSGTSAGWDFLSSFTGFHEIRRKDTFDKQELQALPIITREFSKEVIAIMPELSEDQARLSEVSQKTAEVLGTIINITNTYNAKPAYAKFFQHCVEFLADNLHIRITRHSPSQEERDFIKAVQDINKASSALRHAVPADNQQESMAKARQGIRFIFSHLGHPLPEDGNTPA